MKDIQGKIIATMAAAGSESLDDQQLVSRLQKGDSSAFEGLFHRYQSSMLSFARRELKSEALAEDAVQEVFCKLWLSRAKLDVSLPLKGFLFVCLKNRILNVVRTRKNEIAKNYQFAYDQPKTTNITELQIAGNEIDREVLQLINHLPELKRNILTFSIYKGLSNEQIAEKLDVSTTTVKIYLSQSSRQLRQLISLHGVKFVVLSLLNTLP